MITFLRHPSKVSPSLPALFFHGRKGLLALVSALLFVTAFSDSFAQIVSVRNDYVAAFVNTAQNAGRFWISAGPKKGGQRFLFHGNTSVQMITSNVIFRVERGGCLSFAGCVSRSLPALVVPIRQVIDRPGLKG